MWPGWRWPSQVGTGLDRRRKRTASVGPPKNLEKISFFQIWKIQRSGTTGWRWEHEGITWLVRPVTGFSAPSPNHLHSLSGSFQLRLSLCTSCGRSPSERQWKSSGLGLALDSQAAWAMRRWEGLSSPQAWGSQENVSGETVFRIHFSNHTDFLVYLPASCSLHRFLEKCSPNWALGILVTGCFSKFLLSKENDKYAMVNQIWEKLQSSRHWPLMGKASISGAYWLFSLLHMCLCIYVFTYLCIHVLHACLHIYSICAYLCAYAYVYVCLYVCANVYTWIYVFMCVCLYAYVMTCMYLGTYVCLCYCMCLFMCMYMFVYVYSVYVFICIVFVFMYLCLYVYVDLCLCTCISV